MRYAVTWCDVQMQYRFGSILYAEAAATHGNITYRYYLVSYSDDPHQCIPQMGYRDNQMSLYPKFIFFV